jgi:heme-degrading monooxygenase HmoA
MFARVTTFEGPPEHVDDFRHALVEHMLPALRRLEGYQGVLILADRQGGKVLGVSLWESEESMGASEEAAYWFRTHGAEAASERVTSVERYEVVFSGVVKGTRL